MNLDESNWIDGLSDLLRQRAQAKLSDGPTSSESPTVITSVKSAPFYVSRDFWKDGNPVDIAEFIEKMLGLKPSEGQYEILYTLAGRDAYEWDTSYQQYNLAIGQGGGKNTYIISPYTAYCAYKIANMKDPWRYFSRFLNVPLDKGTRFEMTNSSMVTERQARNVHFAKMQSLLKRCRTKDGRNWFETYAHLDTRDSFGDIQSKTITIPTQPMCGPIMLHSFDSTPTAPEGLHIILGIIDEASRADTDAKYSDMQHLWRVIVGNLNTRFPLGLGKVINFSYLSNSEYDFTYDLIRLAEEERKITDHPIVYSVNRTTFEMNPNVKKTDPSVETDYRNDPTDAAARYEGIKGAAREGFYQPHVDKVAECFVELATPVDYEFKITERVDVDPRTGERSIKRFQGVNLTRIHGDEKDRCWALDPAVSHDAFILKGGYTETIEELRETLLFDDKPELITIRQRPVIDIVIVWQPQDKIPVDILNVGEVLGLLLEQFPNSLSVTSDKFNSEKLRQEVMARGIHSETYSFSNAQQIRLYKTLRLLFWNNVAKIRLDKDHSIRKGNTTKTVGEWNLLEHQRLLKINENKVDHPRGLSKDLADVDAILCNDLLKLEGGKCILGIESLSNYELLNWIELFRVHRATLRSHVAPSLISKRERYQRLSKAMGVSEQFVIRLEEYVDDLHPDEKWIAYLGWEKDMDAIRW
jgi:hypothetical protein